jgi:hypothetical protein
VFLWCVEAQSINPRVTSWASIGLKSSTSGVA